MTNPHDKAIEAAAKALWEFADDEVGWEASKADPKMEPQIEWTLESIRAAIAAYERAMWRPKINWEDAEDPIVKLLVQYPVDEFVAEYEYGEDGYVPDEAERALIEDAIYGFITDLHEKMRAALPLPPVPEGD